MLLVGLPLLTCHACIVIKETAICTVGHAMNIWSEHAGNTLLDLSDPFDLCFEKPEEEGSTAADKTFLRRSKAQERKQVRQEMYKARREARKQQKEGELTDHLS